MRTVIHKGGISDLRHLALRVDANAHARDTAVEEIRAEESGVDVVRFEYFLVECGQGAGHGYLVVLGCLQDTLTEIR